MKRKLSAVFLALTILLSLTSCSKEDPENQYYYRKTLSSFLSGSENMRLPGMAEPVCVLPKEDLFSPELFQSENAGLFNETKKEVVYVKNATQRMYPASLTKCMTFLLTVENVPDLQKEITFGSEVSFELGTTSSLAQFQTGETFKVSDVLYGLMVPSGNDAANILATVVAGSIPEFVRMMNEKAAELGMLNTHFENPHGLHQDEHYTTVYDLYLLVRECIKYPEFFDFAGTAQVTVAGKDAMGNSLSRSYVSGNSYLRNFTKPPENISVRAGKTGYTAKAGRCLILVSEDGTGDTYISIIGKSPTYDMVYQEMNRLLQMVPEEDSDE